MKTNFLKTNSLKQITRLFAVVLTALCVPTVVCHASVEPELTMAIRQKNVPKVQQLLASGANVDERDEGAEQTPLMRAVQVKDAVLVKMLLAHGAAVNAQDDFGKTALMFATEKDDAEIIQLLLRKSANVSVRDDNAVTAGDIARVRGHSRIVKLLTGSQQVAFRNSIKPTSRRAVALQ